MFLSGYHGTTAAYAKEIVSTKKYKLSNGKKEWLGKGIYFYPSFQDAYEWRNTEVIMHSIIEIDEKEYFDIDTYEGEKLYNKIVTYLHDKNKIKISKSYQENQCAIANMIWNMYPKIKAISASFATEKTKIPALLDKRNRRKEFCVRDNDMIKHTYAIRKGDLL